AVDPHPAAERVCDPQPPERILGDGERLGTAARDVDGEARVEAPRVGGGDVAVAHETVLRRRLAVARCDVELLAVPQHVLPAARARVDGDAGDGPDLGRRVWAG